MSEAATLELNENTTHDEIQSYVDSVVKDIEEDRIGEKTDTQKLAADNDIPVTVTDSGEEATSESQPSDASWLDDELKAEVSAYGISEEELADFQSREELERALRFFDRSALEAGRKALAEQEKPEPPRDEQGRFSSDKYEVSLDKDLYDEGLVDELSKMKEHYESRLSVLEQRFAEADAKAEEQRFDGLVDSLGHSDLFGVTGKENSKQLQRRQDLHVQVKAQQIGLETLGRKVDLDQSLVNRVARMVFAEELTKKELKARTQKVSKQSDARLGGSATKAHDQKEPLIEEMERLYKELESA